MKIIGYCWASEQAENDDLPEPGEGVRLIWQ